MVKRGRSPSRSPRPARAAKKRKGKERQQNEIKQLKEELARARGKGGGGSSVVSKPPVSAKGQGRGPRMPKELVGKAFVTASGKPICFGFNLVSGCKLSEPGKACPKGMHVCCEPGCFGMHSLLQHA